jgi:DNA-directed RNA polymerase subunit RPC12/RpoP
MVFGLTRDACYKNILYFHHPIDYSAQVDLETSQQEKLMAIYKCDKCGMSIGTMTCGECGKELVHDTLTLDSGAKVDIAECPEGHGKVKSPQCCGEDMTCSI